MEQIEVLAQTQGVSSMKMAEFKRRVNDLKISSKSKNIKSGISDKDDQNIPFGLKRK